MMIYTHKHTSHDQSEDTIAQSNEILKKKREIPFSAINLRRILVTEDYRNCILMLTHVYQHFGTCIASIIRTNHLSVLYMTTRYSPVVDNLSILRWSQ